MSEEKFQFSDQELRFFSSQLSWYDVLTQENIGEQLRRIADRAVERNKKIEPILGRLYNKMCPVHMAKVEGIDRIDTLNMLLRAACVTSPSLKAVTGYLVSALLNPDIDLDARRALAETACGLNQPDYQTPPRVFVYEDTVIFQSYAGTTEVTVKSAEKDYAFDVRWTSYKNDRENEGSINRAGVFFKHLIENGWYDGKAEIAVEWGSPKPQKQNVPPEEEESSLDEETLKKLRRDSFGEDEE